MATYDRHGAIVLVVTSFFGAYLAVRIAGNRRRRDALLHGGVCWPAPSGRARRGAGKGLSAGLRRSHQREQKLEPSAQPRETSLGDDAIVIPRS